MVETLRNAFIRNRLTMGEISLIRGAIRSLVEGPRRRAIESDTVRAKDLFLQWLTRAERPTGDIFAFFYGSGQVIAEVRNADGHAEVYFASLQNWQLTSMRCLRGDSYPLE
jgi:hypothetical protein